jgi:hypothetical protein
MYFQISNWHILAHTCTYLDIDIPTYVLHLPELATVGMLGFAGRVKGRRDVDLTAWKQTQIEPDTATGQEGGTRP